MREVIFASTSAGSSVSESSTSASTGMEPAASTAFGVAFHVYAGTITSVPAVAPKAMSPQMIADEPAFTQSANGASNASHHSCSKFFTSRGPSPGP